MILSKETLKLSRVIKSFGRVTLSPSTVMNLKTLQVLQVLSTVKVHMYAFMLETKAQSQSRCGDITYSHRQNTRKIKKPHVVSLNIINQ